MAHARRSLALFASLLLSGCPHTEPTPGPIPVAMQPSQGTGLAPLPVSIAGEHFDAAAQTDFEKGSASLDATFQARLLPDAGGAAVSLEAVRLTADKRLEADVPAGIARGGYALEVIDPAGRTGRLAQAFRVVSAPETVTSFRVVPEEPAHAGVPFLVTLTALDGAGTVVDGFTGQVQLTDLTGTVSPSTAGPFTLGRVSLQVTVGTVSAADQVTASDGLGHTGTSAPFPVDPGPPVAVALTGVPATISAGTCSAPVTVALRDAQGNAAPAAATIDVQLQSSPAGALAFHVGGGACSSPVTAVAISPGASSTSFRFRGAAAGTAEIRALPSTLPSTTAGVILTP